ncbi:MAG: hypothetical protein CMI23_00425 [Opitutae bacterium]|nr:hypothetical protein [Opitutae bacterium]
MWGDFAVYNLYNSDKNKSADITLNFGDAGLSADTRCLVYNFWENKLVGYATDSYEGKNIPKNGSLLLRFTPLDGDSTKLVGSNLHLSMGDTEIEQIYTTDQSLKIMLSGVGAQTGDLFFIPRMHSKQAPVKIVRSLLFKAWKITYGKFRLREEFGMPINHSYLILSRSDSVEFS